MKNKSFVVIVLAIIISIIFNISAIVLSGNRTINVNDVNKLLVLSVINIVLNLICMLYFGFKLKTKIYRNVSKKRFLFIVVCVTIIFILINHVLNTHNDFLVSLYVFDILILTFSIYCIRLMYSEKDIFNFDCYLSKMMNLISYIKDQKKGNIILLDTPIHSNIGDSAIALAEKEYLQKKLNINDIIEVTADQLDNMERLYALFTNKNKLILVHGGGFLGDLWPNEENRFRRIVTSFKKNRIIVLPQTIYYDLDNEWSKSFFNRSKKIYEEHKDLTIFAREKKSYNFLKENYENVKTLIVPDIVTTLDFSNKNFKKNGILFCMRADLEKIINNEEQQLVLETIKNKYPNEKITFTDTVIDKMVLPQDRKDKVYSKLKQFASSKLVVTDRLHGMVFAALTSTPCVALGNKSDKVKGVYEWIKENKYIVYLDDISELNNALKRIDINKKYQYQVKKIEEYFIPLMETIKKEDKYGRK